MNLHDKIMSEELKNFCNCPEKYQLIDFLGAGLGAFFIIQNGIFLKRKFSYWNLAGLGLGVLMFYIHTARFHYAEQVKAGTRDVNSENQKSSFNSKIKRLK